MSSLLEILQKKSGQAATNTTAPAPALAPAASHMQTVELHLAVDNRDLAELQAESGYAPEPVAAAEPIGIQDETPALALEPAAEYRAATTGMDIPVAEGADATQ
ncbi:MAG: hypothetical protein FJ170_07265, partial [Gammaproteobacteria bacterium]|nr:hypothetical protein [Gammaproteobacteria bacterium]